MRYGEVLEAASELRMRAKAEAKRKYARDQLAAADSKRANAARKYQDDLQSARSAAQQARAKIRSLGVPEALTLPCRQEAVKAPPLFERPKGSSLRDRNGSILGWIEAVGRLLQAKDRNGSVVGWYDPRQNQTRDHTGIIFGTGDLLSALIMMKKR